MEPINILVTLDSSYIPQLKVLLASIMINDPAERFSVYLLQNSIAEKEIRIMERWCSGIGWEFHSIAVDGMLFSNAPVSRQYPKEMYYRLLAPHILPDSMKRIIYLDPDILVINPLRPLWDMDMSSCLFAAASHTGIAEIANGVNRIRLGTEHDYYNSGVLLIDAERGRRDIIPDDIFSYVRKHQNELILPDQDVLNAVYGSRILPLDDAVWNYDARKYSSYMLKSSGIMDEKWVMENTAILHFCGKAKPWKKTYVYRFGSLYRHYMQIAARSWDKCAAQCASAL